MAHERMDSDENDLREDPAALQPPPGPVTQVHLDQQQVNFLHQQLAEAQAATAAHYQQQLAEAQAQALTATQ